MLDCVSLKSSSVASTAPPPPPPPPPHSQGNSTEDTPGSSAQPSPTANHTQEYTLTVQTNSYHEIWSRIHSIPATNHDEDTHQLQLAQVLHPNRECVEDALQHAKSNTLTLLVKAYFDHSEKATDLCLLLHHSIYRAHSLYDPLHAFLDVLPLDSDSNSHSSLLTQSQCNRAFDLFLEFDRLDNPFPCPNSHNFNDMRRCFSQLKQQLDHRIRKSRSRVRLLRGATASSAVCCVCAAFGTAVALAAHTLVALVAGAFCTTYLPQTSNFTRKEAAHVAQLDAALRGTYVLNHGLDTIDRLVVRLHNSVENDKLLIRLGLERGTEKHTIMEVIKQLRKNNLNFLHLLQDLEEHICLCFSTVNRARALLLQEIRLHRSLMSRDIQT